MNAMVKESGGVLCRLQETLEGFRSKFGYWPTALEIDGGSLALIATVSLTPLGFMTLQTRCKVTAGPEGAFIARGKSREKFDYSKEGWQSDFGHRHDAFAWLGFND